MKLVNRANRIKKKKKAVKFTLLVLLVANQQIYLVFKKNVISRLLFESYDFFFTMAKPWVCE